MASCKEIIELPSLRKLKLLGGREGLDRAVRWVHYIDLPDVLPWVRGGELLFITGIGLDHDENRLLELIRAIAKKNLAGLVISIGPFMPVVPAAAIKLADELKFPLFELPWKVKLVEVTQEVSKYLVMRQIEEKSFNDLLENIIFDPVYEIPTLIRRAAYYGYDLSKPHQVGIVRAGNFESFLNEHHDEVALMKLKERFEQIVRELLNRHFRKSLSMGRTDSLIFMIPEKADDLNNQKGNVPVAQEIIDHCQKKLPGLAVNIGLGNFFTELKHAKTSFDQAQLALKFADFVGEKNQVFQYTDLGVHKLLLELDGPILEAYYQDTIGPLADYDKAHNMELVNTLLSYLQESGNAMQTAKKLFIHKNTLAYRLQKIEKITGKNLAGMHDRVTLQMGLIIGSYLEHS